MYEGPFFSLHPHQHLFGSFYINIYIFAVVGLELRVALNFDPPDLSLLSS
jgi:hypothetical protein